MNDDSKLSFGEYEGWTLKKVPASYLLDVYEDYNSRKRITPARKRKYAELIQYINFNLEELQEELAKELKQKEDEHEQSDDY